MVFRNYGIRERGGGTVTKTRANTEHRLDIVERRLDEIAEVVFTRDDDRAPAEPLDDASRFWALHGLKSTYKAPGAVAFTGAVDLGIGHIEYQWERKTDYILDVDWAERAGRAAALGHPVRMAMLRLLLDQPHTVAELVDALELASTGVAYHHLHQLQAGGWVTSAQRGVWSVPGSRVVPLMAIVIALEEA